VEEEADTVEVVVEEAVAARTAAEVVAVPRTVEAARVVVVAVGMEARMAVATMTVVTVAARMVAVRGMVRAVPHAPVALRPGEPPALTEVMGAAIT
jgi:hypothetical protein